jgi:hypothetical protein
VTGTLFAAVLALGATQSGFELDQELVTRVPQADGTLKERREKFTVLIARDRARMKYASGEHWIIRLDKRHVTELDVLLRSYRTQSFDELKGAWEIANELYLEQIEGAPLAHPRRAELIDELTDGRRKWEEIWKLPSGEGRTRLLAKYRLPEEPPVVEVKRSEETKTVAGVQTQRYESLENGTATTWAYLAPSMDFDARYFEFMEMRSWILPELAAKLRERGMRRAGMPLETFMRTRTNVEVQVVTLAVRAASLDDATFEVPAGYTEQKATPTR